MLITRKNIIHLRKTLKYLDQPIDLRGEKLKNECTISFEDFPLKDAGLDKYNFWNSLYFLARYFPDHIVIRNDWDFIYDEEGGQVGMRDIKDELKQTRRENDDIELPKVVNLDIKKSINKLSSLVEKEHENFLKETIEDFDSRKQVRFHKGKVYIYYGESREQNIKVSRNGQNLLDLLVKGEKKKGAEFAVMITGNKDAKAATVTKLVSTINGNLENILENILEVPYKLILNDRDRTGYYINNKDFIFEGKFR